MYGLMRPLASVVAAVGLIAFSVVACARVPHVVGSGVAGSEQRVVDRFSRVIVGSAIEANVSIGTTPSVTVTADANLLGNVKTQVAGSTLDVHMEGDLETRRPVTVTIVVPQFESVRASSAARVKVDGLTGAAFAVAADSAGSVDIAGQVDELTVDGSSGAILHLDHLTAASAAVALDSAAQADLTASQSVKGTVASAAALTIRGNPSAVDVVTSFAGIVRRQ